MFLFAINATLPFIAINIKNGLFLAVKNVEKGRILTNLNGFLNNSTKQVKESGYG